MADESDSNIDDDDGQAEDTVESTGEGTAEETPPLVIVTQYIKDLSFESPASPDIYLNPVAVPSVEIRVDVTAQGLGDQKYESSLQIEVKAESEDRPIFIVELTYACIASIGDVPPDHVQPLVLIEAPRLIFPFARAILSSVTRDGGFQPLMVNPIDFVELYRQRLAAHGAPN